MQRIARRSLLHATRRAASSSLLTTHTPSVNASTARALATQARRPALPAPLEVDVDGLYKIKYVDLKPASSTAASDAQPKPTIVFIHGSPGSYEDYKYLMPLLQGHARVVGINLPGNGSQVLDEANYYDRIKAIDLAHAAQAALAKICAGDENVFVVGHSFGGHATINVAALNEMEEDAGRKINVRGVALLASAGLRVHLALEKGNLGLLYTLLKSKIGFVEAAGRYLTRVQYTRVWGFPSRVSTDQYVAGLVRCASTDFAVVNDHAARIAHLPSFFAWAKDDAYIQQEIFEDLSRACLPGPRFAFEEGGHNIQKTKADFLAAELLQWTQAVVRGDTAAYTHDIVTRP